jgi:hypothetical protein
MIALAARRSSTLRAASAVTVDSSGRLIVPSGGSVGASAAIASGGMLETLRHRHHERHGRQLRHLIASDRSPRYRVPNTLKRPFRGDP